MIEKLKNLHTKAAFIYMILTGFIGGTIYIVTIYVEAKIKIEKFGHDIEKQSEEIKELEDKYSDLKENIKKKYDKNKDRTQENKQEINYIKGRMDIDE